MYNLFVDRLSPDSLLMLCEVSDKISLVLPLTHSTGQPRPVNTPQSCCGRSLIPNRPRHVQRYRPLGTQQEREIHRKKYITRPSKNVAREWVNVLLMCDACLGNMEEKNIRLECVCKFEEISFLVCGEDRVFNVNEL